jgi:hypothetical protein
MDAIVGVDYVNDPPIPISGTNSRLSMGGVLASKPLIPGVGGAPAACTRAESDHNLQRS